MENKDMGKFTAIIFALAEEYGGTISKAGVDLKFDALKGYSLESVTRASNWLLRNRKEKYPPIPTIKEFIRTIDSIENPKPSCETHAQKQVDIILRYLNYYGSYCEHVFKDSITNYLMTNRWTFAQLGSMKQEDLKWFRCNFVFAYTNLQKDTETAIEYLGARGTIPVNDLKKLIQPGKK